MNRTIGAIMVLDVFTCRYDQARRGRGFNELGTSGLAVVDEELHVVGFISDGDIMKAVAAQKTRPYAHGAVRQRVLRGEGGLTASLAALSFVDDKTVVAYLVVFYVIQSSGLTLANMPVTTWGINALPNDMIAHGNAISNTGRQVGGAVSTALIVTVMTMVTAANAEAGPVLSTAAGIDVAYGISAAVAGIALVIAVLKVRNVKKQAVASPASQAEAPLEIEMEEAREGAAR